MHLDKVENNNFLENLESDSIIQQDLQIIKWFSLEKKINNKVW